MAAEGQAAPTRRLVLLVTAAAAAAAGCLGWAGLDAATGPRPSVGRMLLCVVILFAGVACDVRTRLGAQRLELAWGEAALMISLALVPPAWVVLATPVGVGLWLVRRQPIKAVYNISNYTVAWTAGAAIVAVAGSPPADSLRGLAVLAAAGLVGGLITHVAVALVIAVAQDTSILASWRAGAGVQLLSAVGNVTTALVVLVAARHDARLVAAVPCVGLCLHQGYVGRLRGREERTAAQRQLVAVNALATDLDEAAVAGRAAAQIAALLAADVVQVELPATPTRPAALHQYTRRGAPWGGPAAQAPAVAGRLLADVPIAGAGEPAGRIRVWLAGGSASYLHLSDRDEVALQTLAAATHTALANARAHDQLRDVAEQLRFQATHDRITNLPTHDPLIDQVEHHLAHTRAGHTTTAVALALIDISDFREIVRTLGRPAAHHLLSHAADQLRAAAHDSEFLAHTGSDSFAVFLTGDEPEQIRTRVQALVTAISRPVRLETGGGQVSLHATAGITYCATHAAASGTELLRQATVALDDARTNLDIHVGWYDPAADAASPSALILASELRTALDRHELELHYQPILDLANGWPVAVEALIRWRHPTRGLLRPHEFIPVLQRSPRDHAQLVRWYLDTALRERSHWGPDRDLPIAVNLDARTLLDRDLVPHLTTAITDAGLDPDQLICELAETAALSSLDAVDHVLAELRTLGAGVAIDDFGAGYSPLTQLLRVPATHLKIAAELITDMLQSDQAAALVRAAIEIGRGQGLHVTAQGVTTAEQVAALTHLGCPAAQGRHLVRPLTAARLRTFLAETPRKPTTPTADVVLLQARRSATGPTRRT